MTIEQHLRDLLKKHQPQMAVETRVLLAAAIHAQKTGELPSQRCLETATTFTRLLDTAPTDAPL